MSSRLSLICAGLPVAAAPFLALSAEEPAPAGAVPIRMVGTPALSPDGKTLVFEWLDDLWAASADGGKARRLTQHPARETAPCFSPDGATLYFSSGRAGGLQVFSMPAAGGPATQHTFHSEGAVLETLAPDGNTAIVRGPRDQDGIRAERLIEINLKKEAPEKILFDLPVQWARYSPDGKKLMFSRDGDMPYRKGYKGSRAASVWTYEPASGRFDLLEKSEIEARHPLWTADGAGFTYVSEKDGTFNLVSRRFGDGKEEALTRFKDDGVSFPAVSRDGGTMVFRRGFDLWALHPGKEPSELNLWAAEDLPDLTREARKITGTNDADFSTSGLEIVFSSEGELWAMDTVLKEPHRLIETDAYESDPHFSKDGGWIYFRKDDGLTSNYHRMRRKKAGTFWWLASGFEEQPVTKGTEPKDRLSFSPDGKSIAYLSGKGSICVANADGSSERIIFAGSSPGTFDWSPDGRWLAFDAEDENFNRDIFVVPLDLSRAPFNLSRHPDTEGSPKWSPDGRMIAFTGRRLNNKTGLFYVNLRIDDEAKSSRDKKQKEAETTMKDDPLYRQGQVNNEEPPAGDAKSGPPEKKKEEKEPATAVAEKDEAKKDDKKPAKPKPVEPVRIDFDELSERIHKLDTGTTEPALIVWEHDSKALLYQNADVKQKGIQKIEIKDGSAAQTLDPNRGVPVRMDDKGNLYWLVDNAPALLAKGKLTRHPIEARLMADRTARQRLVFRLVWRKMRDWFYDSTMNGRDWEAMRLKYEDMAATAADSRDFDVVVAMLLGELNASHLSFLSNPWAKPWTDEGAEFRVTRHVGIRFDHGNGSGPLKVGSVIPDSPAARAEPAVAPGEIVLAVDGHPVDAATPETRFLNGRLDSDLTFTLRGADGKEREVELKAIPWLKARELAGDAIITERRRKVEADSGGKLGYIHISRMMWDQFEEFERQIHAAGQGKEGLVIDVRDNGGGFITDHLLTVLCQPKHAITVGREGTPGYPQDRLVYASWQKPIVVLCNQNSFSNAEVFSHAIKTLKRGPLVGVQTAGGVISTGSDAILDAGTLRVPFRGWFLPETGEDMELNGAMPDYPVDEQPGDRVAGRDLQLSKAVEVLTGDLNKAKATAKPFEPRYRNRPAK